MKLAAIGFLAFITAVPLTTHAQEPMNVSVVQLLANPEKYDGKLISVRAFLTFGHHVDLVYLGQQDYLHGISENALWVERTDQMAKEEDNLDQAYVVIVGVFSAKPKRFRLESWVGGITKISKCVVWSRPNDPLMHKLRDLVKAPPK